MRNALNALTDELRRLRDEGVKSVAVSDAALAALRAAANSPSARERGSASPMAAAHPPLPDATSRRGYDGPKAASNPAAVSAPSGVDAAAGRVSPRPAPAAMPAAKAAPPPKEPLLPPPPTVALPPGAKADRMAALRAQILADPTCRARLRPGKQIVVGVGDLDAKIMFVGEAPGADEEVQGEPFVGPAGQLLNRMIAGTGLKRSDVYIGNIMNWRPEMSLGSDGIQVGNRPPTAEEMAYCLPFLRAQIEIVAPSLLVALGASAAQALLGQGTFKTLGEVRGQWREFEGKPLMVTYHPSYILRNPTNRSKRLIWEDFLKVMERAGLPVSDKQRGYFLER